MQVHANIIKLNRETKETKKLKEMQQHTTSWIN